MEKEPAENVDDLRRRATPVHAHTLDEDDRRADARQLGGKAAIVERECGITIRGKPG